MIRLFISMFFALISISGLSQTEITLDFPVDTSKWEIGGDAGVVDFDGINGEDEILLTADLPSQIGYIKYKDFINFAQCKKWVLDFDFRLWTNDDNGSGDGFAFTLLNRYKQGEGGSNLGIPQTISSLGLVVAFDTYDDCEVKNHDNPEIQINEIDVYHGYNYSENCIPRENPRNRKFGMGNYLQDIKILRSENYRPARIIYDDKHLSVLVDIDNDGTLDEVLGPTFLTLDYNYGMQMAFTASTGSKFDNQSIKNVSMSIESDEIISERLLQKCPGEDLLIEGGIQFISYTWLDSNNQIIGTDEKLSVSNPGTYTLKKEFLCGIETETIKVTETDLSIDSIKVNQQCGFAELEVFASGGDPSYLYSIVDGSTSQSYNRIKILQSGEYIVQLRDRNDCFVRKAITVEQVSSPLVLQLYQTGGNEITANAGGGVPPYTYQFENRQQSNSNLFEIPGSGIFKIKVEDSLGCTMESQIEVACDSLEIPNFFSPNGDGINDYWQPSSFSCYPDFEARIFDQQGRELYRLNARNQTGWDGTYNGKRLPSTDYWYSIKLNDFVKPLSGHFNLYR